jgi:tetratricopeptide (TPR) repeat protein
MGDLDQAVACFEGAVALIGANSPDRAGCLSNLGAVLSDRYARIGALADLNGAITRLPAGG